MTYEASTMTLIGVLVALTFIQRVKSLRGKRFRFGHYLHFTWIFFLCFAVSEVYSFRVGVWILALPCFWALREYFSLLNIRLQDRVGILGAYLSIPFMIYFIQVTWYGMFIVSIPVYSFLAIPLLITLGGKETEGTVFSIGAIVFGLFLFVFCLGHVGYLMFYTTWKAALLIIMVAVCDISACFIKTKTKAPWTRLLACYLIPIPLTVTLGLLLSSWAVIPAGHSVVLGCLIPLLVVLGHHTTEYVKADLGIRDDHLEPGRGQILDNLKGLLFAAPVAFHYMRYFLALP